MLEMISQRCSAYNILCLVSFWYTAGACASTSLSCPGEQSWKFLGAVVEILVRVVKLHESKASVNQHFKCRLTNVGKMNVDITELVINVHNY